MLKQRLYGKAAAGEYVAVIALTALSLCSAQLTACKKKPPAPLSEPDPSAEVPEIVEPALPAASAAPAYGPVPARCHELAQSNPFRIGEVTASKPAPEDADDGGLDDEDEVPAPFSVELGQARSDADGFVISALRSLKGQSHALLAVLNSDAGNGKLIDLGAVHGDPDPPLFAEHGKDLLVAASDADAGGGMLKIGLVRDARGAAQISWGPEITGVRRDSTFALEVAGDRALVAYATESGGKIRVYGAALDPGNLKQKVTPEPLSAAGSDVDSPRLALRKGGYWLAVARALDAPKQKAKPKPDDTASDLGEEGSLLDIGTRRIEVSKLDAQGKAASSALVVTPAGARPMSFELASAADGGAYIAYRGDDSTPGADGGALELVHVKADGTFEKVPLTGDENGTGTPSLLVDSSDATRVWLAAPGENSSTWFGRVVLHTTMAADALVRGGDLIAGRDGKLLLSRSKGTAAEFSLVQCGD